MKYLIVIVAVVMVCLGYFGLETAHHNTADQKSVAAAKAQWDTTQAKQDTGKSFSP